MPIITPFMDMNPANDRLILEYATVMETPTVKASIVQQHNFGGNMSSVTLVTETTTNSSLTVGYGSLLILFCFASYPVKWTMNGKQIHQVSFKEVSPFNATKEQWDTHHWKTQSYYNDSNYGNPLYQMQVTGYQSRLQIDHMDNMSSGVFDCQSEIPNLSTVIHLMVDSRVSGPPEAMNASEAHLLQAGFDTISTVTNSSPELPFVCFKPRNFPGQIYFILPNNETVSPLENKGGYQLVISSSTSPFVYEGTLKVPDQSILDGRYRLMADRLQLHIFNIRYIPLEGKRKKLESFDASMSHFRVHVKFGKLLEIVGFFEKQHELNGAAIEGSNPTFDSACISHEKPIPVVQLAQECGILGVGRLFKKSSLYGIRLVLTSKKSCDLRIFFYLLDGKIQISSLHFRVQTGDGTRVNAHEGTVQAGSLDQEGSVEKSIGDNFTLRCILQSCDLMVLGWCQLEPRIMCAWKSTYYIQFENWKKYDLHNNYSGDLINNSAMQLDVNMANFSAEIVFTNVSYLHSGLYGCAYFTANFPRLYEIRFSNFTLIVGNSNISQPVINVAGSDGETSGVTKFVNQSFTLRCTMVSFEWELLGWCKAAPLATCWWRFKDHVIPENLSFDSSLADDPQIDSLFTPRNGQVMSADLIFKSLQKFHSGTYSCISAPRRGKKHLENLELNFQNFTLQVLAPVLPHLIDSDQDVVRVLLKPNDHRELSCPVDGVPEPKTTWKGMLESASQLGSVDIIGNGSKTLEIDEPGIYECIAENVFGNTSRKFLVGRIEDGGETIGGRGSVMTIAIVSSVSLAIIFLLGAFATSVMIKRRRRNADFRQLETNLRAGIGESIQLNNQLPLNDQTDNLVYDRNYEVDKASFEQQILIGHGEFGKVFKGVFNKNNMTIFVAIKVPKDPKKTRDIAALAAELKIMVHLRPHVNVVNLIGACTSHIKNGELFVLTELCGNGSLLDFIVDNFSKYETMICMRTKSEEVEKEISMASESLLSFAYQAANGMEYLAVENIIHRDLALRNLLLTSSNVVKISDFGLARRSTTAYKKPLSPNVPVPIFWMAPESLKHGQYTVKSDIWSFGVVLWEMFSFGSMPYLNYDISSVYELIYLLQSGHRLSKPKLATEDTYILMLDCWADAVEDRPTFSSCKRRIAQNLETQSPGNYANTISNLNNAWRALGNSQAVVMKTNDDNKPSGSSGVQEEIESKCDQVHGPCESMAIGQFDSSFLEKEPNPYSGASATEETGHAPKPYCQNDSGEICESEC